MKRTMVIFIVFILLLVGCKDKKEVLQKEVEVKQEETTELKQDEAEDTSTVMEGTLEEISRSLFETYKAGEYEKVLNEYAFEDVVLNQLSADLLKSAWDQLVVPNGDFIEIQSAIPSESKGIQIIGLVCKYSKASIMFNVAFDSDKKIAGFTITPYVEPGVMPDTIEEKEVSFGKEGLELPAILTLPKGVTNCPVVILVHGSGPNDKDETIGPNKPFRDIAWQLAAQGIGVLRYDKRTKVYPESFMNNPNATVYEETVEDAGLAYQFLVEDKSVEEAGIYILGHSLGGYLMPRIAREVPNASGYIILAGSVRHLEDIIVEQVNYIAGLDGTVSEEEQKGIDSMKKLQETVKSLDSGKDYKAEELLGIPKSYWLDLSNYDPVALMKETTHPTLILQGDRDYQVTETEFNLWQEGLADNSLFTLKLYKGLNHLFMYGDKPSVPDEYLIEASVSQEVTSDIAGWILSKK